MLKRASILLLVLFFATAAWAAENFLVTDIEVEGASRVKVSDVLSAISLRVGQTIYAEDVDRAIQAIYHLGRFSDVAVEPEPLEEE